MSLGRAEDKHGLSYGLHDGCQGIDQHQHPVRMVAELGTDYGEDVVGNDASKSDDKQDVVEIERMGSIKLQLAYLGERPSKRMKSVWF